MNSKFKETRIQTPIKLKPAGPAASCREASLNFSGGSSCSVKTVKSCEKTTSPLRILTKPNQSKSEIISEILKRRNIFEESLLKITKNYAKLESQMFLQISNQDEIDLLVATRPGLLNPQPKSQSIQSTPSRKESKPGHRRLLSKGSKDLSESSHSSRNSVSVKADQDESKIRETLGKMFQTKKKELLQHMEKTFHENLEENKEIIEQYWREVISKLERKLEEASVVTEESETDQDQVELIQKLAEEIENRVKKDFEARSKFSKSIPKKEKEKLIRNFQSQVEIEQLEIISQEKKSWKSKISEVQEECKERIWLEHEDLLLRKEIEMRRQAEFELQEILKSLKQETDSAIFQKAQKLMKDREISQIELEEVLKYEAEQELVEEEIQAYKVQLFPRLKVSLSKDLRSALFPQIEIDLKLRLEEAVFKDLSQGFTKNQENFKRKLEKDLNSKLMEIECNLESSRAEKAKKAADERFVRIEKDLRIGYLKKLDKLKAELRKDFEVSYGDKEKNLRNLVTKEKSETCQIKAQINVIVNQINSEKQAIIKSMISQEDQFTRMIREASRRTDQSQLRSSPEHSKSPKKSFFIDEEVSSLLPRPLPPPVQSSSLEEPVCHSPKRKLLKHYDTKEIVNEIIMKKHEDLGKSQNSFYRVVETPARPKSTIPFLSEVYSSENSVNRKETPQKKSKYFDLLHKKYGVVEPRGKK